MFLICMVTYLDHNQILQNEIKNLHALLKNKQFKELVSLGERLLLNSENSATVHNFLGVGNYNLKNFNESIKNFETAINLDPQNINIRNNYSTLLINLGINAVSEQTLEKAKTFFIKAITISPKYAPAYTNLGNIYTQLRDYKKAIKNHKKSIEINPENAHAHNNLGIAYKNLEMDEEALEYFNNALKIDSNHFDACVNKAITLGHLGLKESAIEHYRKALTINPNSLRVYCYLSGVVSFKEDSQEIKQMLIFYEDQNITNEEKIQLSFALGNIYENLKNFKKSFQFYQNGNKLKNSLIKFNLTHENELLKNLKKIFSNITQNKVNDNKHPNIVFILGMPRSGTSLIEQIISSHSQVYGCGELDYLNAYLKNVSIKDLSINKNKFEKLQYQYYSNMEDKGSEYHYITDKMPMNFKWIGYIINSFPKSKIIHIHRDPKATCFSIFKNNFVSEGNEYAYDLKNITNFYNIYLEYMRFWNGKFKNVILNVDYEKLVNNSDFEIKRIISFLDLNWEDSCLKFYENKRSVKTLSKFQVRNEIYSDSSKKWRKYTKYLNKNFNNLKLS